MLNSIGIQMLELNPMVVKKPTEEPVGGRHQPTFMEVHERNNIAIKHQWVIFVARYDPFVPSNPHVEEALFNETFHARMVNVKARPWLH
jgi:hypothetical protein